MQAAENNSEQKQTSYSIAIFGFSYALLVCLFDEIREKDDRFEDGMLSGPEGGLNSIFLGLCNLVLSRNWLRSAKCLDTWMGMGTMILELSDFESKVAPSDDDFGLLLLLAVKALLVRWQAPVFILFHLARRFWNQIFTCTSLKPNFLASSDLSFNVKYFLDKNSCSSSCSWKVEKAVRRLRWLGLLTPSCTESEIGKKRTCCMQIVCWMNLENQYQKPTHTTYKMIKLRHIPY